MRGSMRVAITPADVGRRVSVRSQQSGEGHTMTDAVGHLISWADGQLQIRRRDETIATIAEEDLLAGKLLPDTPPTRRSGRYSR